MKSWPEPIQFRQPLRDVRLATRSTSEADWAERLQQCEQASYERGRLEGEKALSEQLLRQRGEVLELQNGVFASMQQALPQLVRACENALISLALEAARKLVADMPVPAEMIEAAVRETLAQVEESAVFSVQLHPEDLALLQRMNSPVLLSPSTGERMRFEASSEVSRGGCLVKTRFGLVDGRRLALNGRDDGKDPE
ncbi:MAG: FliH/SctL family protein, partial [Verrucomicrobiota bacterium]